MSAKVSSKDRISLINNVGPKTGTSGEDILASTLTLGQNTYVSGYDRRGEASRSCVRAPIDDIGYAPADGRRSVIAVPAKEEYTP
jgi:hypothetical protein